MRKLFGCMVLALAAGIGSATNLRAELVTTRASDVGWTGVAEGGAQVKIPAGDRPSVVLFYRPQQGQSREALAELMRLKPEGVQMSIVVSGPQAAEHAKALAAEQKGVPVIADPDYVLSGRLNVHAWPTTVIVNKKGDELGHIGGISKSYGVELSGYIDYAAGKINKDELDKRVADRRVVGDDAVQAAGRHLQIAQMMLLRGQYDDAEKEVAKGIELNPQNPHLRLAQVRVLAHKGDGEQARKALEAIQPGSVPQHQWHLAQGRVLLASGDVGGAIKEYQESIKLNPSPAEAYYELGLAYQKNSNWQDASDAFRKAFEASR